MTHEDHLAIALRAATEAVRIIRSYYETDFGVRTKEASKTFVTEVDEKVEKAIIAILQNETPYGVLGEESGESTSESDWQWIIDPIDGTKNFIRKLPYFSTSIGLSKNGTIEAGVVANPVQEEYFSAARGLGAKLNGTPIHVSKTQNLSEAIMFHCHGHGLESKERFSKLNSQLATKCSMRKIGTTALELCYVANGGVDAFISSGDEIWDYAAGLLIVEEAGGKITDWRGDAWSQGNSYILATNSRVHDDFLAYTQPLQSTE